uniref:Uncharacterized protein n=1 Tax=Anguilla anguilla TaxID=7936 RepID=A0A0E9TZ55_ANGAN
MWQEFKECLLWTKSTSQCQYQVG